METIIDWHMRKAYRPKLWPVHTHTHTHTRIYIYIYIYSYIYMICCIFIHFGWNNFASWAPIFVLCSLHQLSLRSTLSKNGSIKTQTTQLPHQSCKCCRQHETWGSPGCPMMLPVHVEAGAAWGSSLSTDLECVFPWLRVNKRSIAKLYNGFLETMISEASQILDLYGLTPPQHAIY